MKRLLVSVLMMFSTAVLANNCNTGYQPFGLLGALINNAICEATKPDYTNNTQITLPTGWQNFKLNPEQISAGYVISSIKPGGSWVAVSAVKKGDIKPELIIENARKKQADSLEITEQTVPKETTVDGRRAWSWETLGSTKTQYSSTKWALFTTVIEGNSNLLLLESRVGQANPNLYDRAQELRRLPSEITIIE
jgi:hypothetical protein